MKKLFISIVSGTIILFIWNAISWMVLPFHSNSLQNLPQGAIDPQVLQNIPQPGVFHSPGLPAEETPEAWQQLIKESKRGPVVSLMVVLPKGVDPLSPQKFLSSLLLNLLMVIMAIILIRLAQIESYTRRVAFFVVLSLLIATLYVAQMIWFGFPLYYTFANVIDPVVSWTLIGLVLGKTL
ncbi:hypothetical protein [Candidatus Uabimicrobium amorphum]|uniref:Uncharacterized protein n=1 Tax=Uabimicrobium amorphum TaxID=2596890 RepID=A0A5S9IVP8_UABAM|nr:hypothetical protein [Candidatus Uabimicrobium amorphum]BBM87950.1 hypothetical protein UABAM_06366 [Candidatus Uabimicrobium amorphum]